MSKIYLIVLVVFVVVESVLTGYLYSWLSSIDNPRTVISNFEYFSYWSATFLWISAIVLLLLANIVLWKARKSWAFWTTFLYFAFFIVLYTFWIDRSFLEFKRDHGFLVGSYSFSPIVGVGLLISATFIVFFNQFVGTKMRDKMFPPEQPVEALSEDEKIDESSKANES